MAPIQPLRVLCMDGGGVRGMASLLILREIMLRVSRDSSSTESHTSPLPCEVFDLICGTSTGGLSALLLGRLRMSVDEAIVSYLDFAHGVIGESPQPSPRSRSPSSWNPLKRGSISHPPRESTPIYDASKLEKWIKDITERITGDPFASMAEPHDEMHCRTFVVGITQTFADAPPRLFRTYSTRTSPADGLKVWEAARATTATSPFFGPATVGSPPEKFIDGGFSGANNPSQLALHEVAAIFPDRPITCFLSLGTGSVQGTSVAGIRSRRAEACEKIYTSCDLVADIACKEFRKKYPQDKPNPYFRFSIDRSPDTPEWKREELERLAAVTKHSLDNETNKQAVENCVQALQRDREIEAKSS